MSKKQFFAIVDSETSITDKVVDFAMVIADRQGNIHAQMAILTRGVFNVDSLFYDRNASGLWSQQSVARRMDKYAQMLDSGARMLASVAAVNTWINKAIGKYNPTLTAYNLAFDAGKCANTGIDLTGFTNRFCLWHAAAGNICNTKAYRRFVMENHLFNTPTEKGNMSFRTDAEAVTGFLSGNMTEEPHTSLEDVIGYELPTLVHILKKRDWREKITPYNWRAFQVKNHFTAK